MRTFDTKQFTTIPLDHKQRQCGIYCIRNTVNGKVYIGSSINCYHRIMSQHYYELRRGKHSNPHLQAAWLEYGEDKFETFIIEECEKENLIGVEQLYLDNTSCTNREFGYNINQLADRTILTEEQKLKISLAKKGKKRPASVRMKISEANRKRKWSNEQREKFIASMKGQHRSNETKQIMSAAQKKVWETRLRYWTEEVRKIMMSARKGRKE